MNMPLILLYNLDTPKGAKIRRMCLPLGLRTRLVTPEEYGLPLGDLVDGAAPETPWTGETFGDEMLVLVNCTGPLLDRFRLSQGSADPHQPDLELGGPPR